MARMYRKLVGGIMMATLIHGNNANGCASDAEKTAMQTAAIARLTDACQTQANSNSGQPPACGATADACGFLVQLDIAFNCAGDACASVPQSVLAARSQTVPIQNCFPKACDNDADRTVFMGFTEQSIKHSLCDSFQQSMKDAVPSQDASIQPTVTIAKPLQMSCNKNSDGLIEIEGVVIPDPPNDDKDHGEHTGGSMETCGDVKAAYKAAKCCGQPSKSFSMGMERRRLSNEQTEEELLESVKSALRRAKAEGGSSKARSLAESIDAIVAKHF